MHQALQQTLKKQISCSGIGLHSGVAVSMTLCPAAPDTGIIFKRTDVTPGPAEVAARWDQIQSGILSTTLGNGSGITIGTVEHLMAALSGCGIDNVIVELNGPEVPVMDGSSAPFVLLVECAGVLTQEVPRNYIKVLKSVVVCDGDRSMHLSPSEDFSISFEIDFDSDVVSRQAFTLNVNERSFKEDLGGARTFGFAEEIHALRKNGFGRGGSLENAVIVDGDTVLNKGGLRFEDEFVRHKVLDCVGDLYLAGCPILAHVQCIRSGHSLSHKLLKSLFSDQSAWKFETFSSSGRDGVHQASAPNTPEPVAATA